MDQGIRVENRNGFIHYHPWKEFFLPVPKILSSAGLESQQLSRNPLGFLHQIGTTKIACLMDWTTTRFLAFPLKDPLLDYKNQSLQIALGNPPLITYFCTYICNRNIKYMPINFISSVLLENLD